MSTNLLTAGDMRHLHEAARELEAVVARVSADPRAGDSVRRLFGLAEETYRLALSGLEGDLTLARILSARNPGDPCDHQLGLLVDDGQPVRQSAVRPGLSLVRYTYCPDCGARLEGGAGTPRE